MYKNEPQFKEIATVRSVQVGASNELNEDLIQEILNETPIQEERLRRIVDRWEPNGYGRILIMRDMEREGSITGFSLFRCFDADEAENVLGSKVIAHEIKKSQMKKIVLIDGVYAMRSEHMHSYEQLVLTETLTHCIAEGYDYSLFANQLTSKVAIDLNVPANYLVYKGRGFCF